MPAGVLVHRTAPCALQLRPVSDLKNTLLHEMIHAELFLEGIRDRGDHGPKFQARMDAINAATCVDPQVMQRPHRGVRGACGSCMYGAARRSATDTSHVMLSPPVLAAPALFRPISEQPRPCACVRLL